MGQCNPCGALFCWRAELLDIPDPDKLEVMSTRVRLIGMQDMCTVRKEIVVTSSSSCTVTEHRTWGANSQ